MTNRHCYALAFPKTLKKKRIADLETDEDVKS